MFREALLLERAGRLAEAEAAYERLLARWPDSPDCWYNLGVLQRQARRFDAALASYQQALDHGVTRPEEAHLNRGVIYADYLRQDDAAERELNAALALNPRYVPALLNLANLHEDRGQRDAALALYEKILALDHACFEALARYANIKTAAGANDPLFGQLRQAIVNPAATPADKASLGFALGRALDSCGAYNAAFEAYATANRESRLSAGPGYVPYDRQRHEQFIDQLIAAFTPRAHAAKTPASTVRPIFICGMFRSGSTLTEQVLAAHPRVTPGGEIDLLPTLVQTKLAPFPSALGKISPEELARLAGHYLDSLAKLFPGAQYVTDKRPDNFLYIGLIKTLFPDARIIHSTRNPLDNCLSIFFLHLDHGMGYALDLIDTGHYYRQYRRLMAHWKALYGGDILDFDYDAFVHEPRPAVEKLLAFCGLEWNEKCLSFERGRKVVKTASVWQVREPLYQRSSGRWRNYARQLQALREYLGEFN
jgi:hypothetical protein